MLINEIVDVVYLMKVGFYYYICGKQDFFFGIMIYVMDFIEEWVIWLVNDIFDLLEWVVGIVLVYVSFIVYELSVFNIFVNEF